MLSCYILTFNSERYLERIFKSLKGVVDDWVLVDSGSTDKTRALAQAYGAKFVERKLDNFRDQRNFAITHCKHEWVFALDSDEVPDAEFVESLARLKADGFRSGNALPDGYKTWRKWFLFGRSVRAFLPVSSPDAPLRIFQKSIVSYGQTGNMIHEEASGANVMLFVEPGYLQHYSCESVKDLIAKMNTYTSLAALDMRQKGKSAGSWFNIYLHAVAAGSKWYFKKGGFRDGSVGVLLGFYAFLYTFLKYAKLKFDYSK